MDDLIAFVRARLDEREALAIAAKKFHPTPWRLDPDVETTMDTGRWVADANADGVLVANGDAPAKFYAAIDPAYVLADVAAKRQIIALSIAATRQFQAKDSAFAQGASFALYRTVKILALPYADHPDYQGSWRP